MTEAAKTIWDLFRQATENNLYWLLYLLALGFLLTEGKKIRNGVVYPSLCFLLLVFNPVTYAVIWDRVSYSNWRLFWMVPAEGIICFAAVRLLSHFRHAAGRLLCGAAVLAVLAVCGHSVYATPGTGFVRADNLYRLPEEAVAAARILLEQDAEPRAVVSDGISCYVRQYSSDIRQMYGRDAKGYIHGIDADRRRVWELLDQTPPDFGAVYEEMGKLSYDYLVLFDGGRYDDMNLLENGFRRIGEAGIYSLYERIPG